MKFKNVHAKNGKSLNFKRKNRRLSHKAKISYEESLEQRIRKGKSGKYYLDNKIVCDILF